VAKILKQPRHIVKFGVGLLLAVTLIYLAFNKVDWQLFWAGMADCQWWWVAASMGAGVSALVLRGFRWRRLLLPIEPTTTRTRATAAYCIGNLCNSVFPASGELVRSALASTHPQKDYDKVLGTAAAERVIDLLCLALILLAVAIVGWDFIGQFVTENILTPVANDLIGSNILWGIGCGLLLITGTLLLFKFGKNFSLIHRIRHFLQGVWAGIISIKKMEKTSCFLLDTALIWALYWFQIIAISHALSLDLLPKDALLLSALGSIASVIPVPGGMGAYHYIIALTLSVLYGFDWNQGILMATLCHESQLLVSLASGTAAYFILPSDKGWRAR
jgi:uncharacterized protein (TIRG00374 family)